MNGLIGPGATEMLDGFYGNNTTVVPQCTLYYSQDN